LIPASVTRLCSNRPVFTVSRLIENIQWERLEIPGRAAEGGASLVVGSINRGEPRATILAGVHGDEGPWGAWAIHKFLSSTDLDELTGSIKIIPAANPLAMEADSRVAPLDSLDLNRVFPGDSSGSYTQRLAAMIKSHSLEDADYVIDLHGGGSWCVNSFAFVFPGSEVLAEAFNPPFLLESPMREGTVTGYASNLGSKVTSVEMGGRCVNEDVWAQRIGDGLKNALGEAGVLNRVASYEKESILVGPSCVLRPSRGGVFVPELDENSVGTVVNRGTLLGRLVDPATMCTLEKFVAPFPKTALLLLRPRVAVVEGGAMTYVVAPLS
jgi:predicted deacylase